MVLPASKERAHAGPFGLNECDAARWGPAPLVLSTYCCNKVGRVAIIGTFVYRSEESDLYNRACSSLSDGMPVTTAGLQSVGQRRGTPTRPMFAHPTGLLRPDGLQGVLVASLSLVLIGPSSIRMIASTREVVDGQHTNMV